MTPRRLTLVGLLATVFTLTLLGTSFGRSHTVGRGDSLWTVARRYGVSVQALAKANHLKESSILQPGRKLVVPGSQVSSSTQGASGGAQAAVRRGTVAKAAPLRSGPAVSSRKIGSLPAGAPVKVLATKWHWHYVKTASGKMGWVGDFLVRVEAPAVVKPVAAVRRCPPTRRVAKSISGRRYARSGSASRRVQASQSFPASPSNAGLLRTAYAQAGARYRFGGSSRGGFDCSGFTRYVYRNHGVSLPHSSAAQFSHGQRVEKSELKQGDLVFFRTRGRSIGHVGVYVGDGKFIHASNPRGGVRVDSLNSGYYGQRYVGARRVK